MNKVLSSLKEIPADYDHAAGVKAEIIAEFEHEMLEAEESAQIATEQAGRDKKNKRLYEFYAKNYTERAGQLKLLLECYK